MLSSFKKGQQVGIELVFVCVHETVGCAHVDIEGRVPDRAPGRLRSLELAVMLMFAILIRVRIGPVRGFSPGRRVVDPLFRCFAVEVFVVLFRFGACMVDNAVPMIRR